MASDLAKQILTRLNEAGEYASAYHDEQIYDMIDELLAAQPQPARAEQVRVLRLIEYVGTREAVTHQLTRSSYFPGGVGTRAMTVRDAQHQELGALTMTSVLLTQWPETLQTSATLRATEAQAATQEPTT